MNEKIGNYYYSPVPIGRGSYSIVFLGIHETTGEKVAIKKINVSPDDYFVKEHIDSEVQIMQKLNHKNIIKFYDSVHDKYGNVFIIMEYCENGTFAKFLNNKSLKEKYALKFMVQIVDALKYLIKNNIIHRDLKPQNILMDKNNVLKLSDFGFAKIFDNEENMTRTICGSPIYMAPEIIKYNSYTNKSDLWSLGVILYEIIIGKPPYKASTHLELINKIDKTPVYLPLSILISDHCRDLIQKLLQKDPNRRIDWGDLFDHPWLNSKKKGEKDKKKDRNGGTTINLENLIVDYDYSGGNKNISAPISIPGKNIKDDDRFCFSPMFNSGITATPNENNGFVIISTSYAKKMEKDITMESSNDSNSSKEIEENSIKTERNVSDSLLDYMGNTINYFRSYYW